MPDSCWCGGPPHQNAQFDGVHADPLVHTEPYVQNDFLHMPVIHAQRPGEIVGLYTRVDGDRPVMLSVRSPRGESVWLSREDARVLRDQLTLLLDGPESTG